MAGVHFFSPIRFEYQKPGRDQRQGLMVMPTSPMAHFIIGQTRFTLTALEAFFNSMGRFGHSRQVHQWRLAPSIAEVKVNFYHCLLVTIEIANHHREFPVSFLSLRRAGHHRAGGDLDPQRPFGPIAHLQRLPTLLRQCRTPAIQALPGTLGATASTAGRRHWTRQITNQRVAWNRQQITLAQRGQSTTKPVWTPHLIITRERISI
jgi:hypothetical protein